MRNCLCILAIILAACGGQAPQAPLEFRSDGTLSFLRADGSVIRTISIEIADDEESRERGLMGRRQMTLDEGMLFLFSAPDSLSFWMANTPIPLDIMFLAADSSIVNIAHRTTPLSREFIRSSDLAQYVVEVRGGFSDRFGIDSTASVRWSRSE